MNTKLRDFATPTISDALDVLGINGGCEGLRPLAPGLSLAGPAHTLHFEDAAGKPAPAADYIDDVPAGHVVTIANGGRTYCTVWGDLLTMVAQARGVEGTIIDGCCRDASAIIRLRFPLFSKSAFMKSGKNRVRLAARQTPVKIGGQVVEPGDFVRGDDSGVVVVPAAKVDDVADLCQQIQSMESKVEADARAGVPLAEARQRHGYNQIALAQTRAAAR